MFQSRRGYSKSTTGVTTQTVNGAINTAAPLTADVVFEIIPDAFWCNGSGNLDLQLQDGQHVSFTVTASQYVPVRANKLLATSSCGTVIALIAQ